MTSVIDIRTRKPITHPHLRLVEAVRRARCVAAVADGYPPKVLPIPAQRVNCVSPVEVVSSSGEKREWL